MAAPVKHPIERAAARQIAIGGANLAIASVATVQGLPAVVIAWFAILGGMVMAVGVRARLAGPMAIGINRSMNALRLGRFDEARGLLADVETRFGRRLFRRPILMQRAELALHDGLAEEALLLAEEASRVSTGVVNRELARSQRAEAKASVALLRAGRGDSDGAKAAMTEAMTDAALAPARARVAVAELVLLSRANDRGALRQRLDENRSLLFEATTPRERALVRALDRMLESRSPSPYREPGDTKPRDAAKTAAGWVAQLAPEAAGFVVEGGLSAGPGEGIRFEAPTADAEERIERDRRAAVVPPKTLNIQPIALVVVGVAMAARLLVHWLRADAARRGGFWTGADETWGTVAILVALIAMLALPAGAGLIARGLWMRRKNATGLRALRAASLAILSGDHAKGRALLTPLLGHHAWSFRAQASLSLACVDEREGDFVKALVRCDTALGLSSTGARRTAAYDFLLPAIHAERAYLLAVLDREDESTAEVCLLARDFPAYALLGVAEFRVKLAQLLRRGDTAAAARLGRERSIYMQLGLRDELVLAVLDVALGPPDDEARARLWRQLDGDPRLAKWFAAVAPALSERFRSGAAQPRLRVEVSPVATAALDECLSEDASDPPESGRSLALRA